MEETQTKKITAQYVGTMSLDGQPCLMVEIDGQELEELPSIVLVRVNSHELHKDWEGDICIPVAVMHQYIAVELPTGLHIQVMCLIGEQILSVLDYMCTTKELQADYVDIMIIREHRKGDA